MDFRHSITVPDYKSLDLQTVSEMQKKVFGFQTLLSLKTEHKKVQISARSDFKNVLYLSLYRYLCD